MSAMSQQPNRQTALDRAGTFTAIARLIVDNNLPAPHSVAFRVDDGGRHLELDFDTAEQAQAWGQHFETDKYRSDRVYQPDWREGPIRTYSVYARPALGFDSVHFTGWSPVDGGEPR
jgi:hypothetical protein